MFNKRLPEIIFILLSVTLAYIIINNSQYTTKATTLHHSPKIEYGINIDSLLIYRDTVSKGQSISNILSSWKVSAQTIDLLVSRAEGIFDLRSIKAGKPYLILYSNDSLQSALYMIYEPNYQDYVVFVLTDSVHLHYGKKDIITSIKSSSGVITSSLWDAIERSEAGIDLALLLSDIYAWSVDFYGLQKGDWFKVIYEELSIDGKPIATGRVLASTFSTNGKEFNAFWFLQDSVGEYYDANGQSLKRAFLKAPLQFSRISSGFSYSRMHPILKYRRPHLGVDYSAPAGTPVQAIGSGVVEKAGYSGQAGIMVKIRHKGGYSTAYLHLSKLGAGIRQGAKVNQSQIIGYVGSTGLSTGPHLDFRFYKNNIAIDPLKVESPPAKPVDSVHLERFNNLQTTLFEQLKKIELKETPIN